MNLSRPFWEVEKLRINKTINSIYGIITKIAPVLRVDDFY